MTSMPRFNIPFTEKEISLLQGAVEYLKDHAKTEGYEDDLPALIALQEKLFDWKP